MKKGTFEIIIGIVMMTVTAGLWRGWDMAMTYLYDTTIEQRLNADVPLNQMYGLLEKTGNCLLFVAMALACVIVGLGVNRLAKINNNTENKENEK